MKPLRVVYDRWDDGWWVSRIAEVRGVHSNGRTIEEARRRVREALAIADDEGWNAKRAAAVELIDEVHLSVKARKSIEEREAALAALQAAAAEVERTTEAAIRALIGGMGLGQRDVAAFLNLSHQRVQQLAASGTYDVERTERASIARESEVPYRADRRSAAKRSRKG